MLALTSTTVIYLACGVTDLRKSFNGLSGIVEETLERDPTSGQVFVFCNRRRDRMKILYWDGSGLCVWTKRLEKGTFSWPENEVKSLRYRAEELQMLIAGIEVEGAKRKRWYRKEHREDDLRQRRA
jgi:transposase